MSDEAKWILRASETAPMGAIYKFRLANFSRKDILGLSVGKHRIFVSYELTRLAYEQENYLWLLRQTLAHEIAHDVLGRGSEQIEPPWGPKLGLANRITARDLGLSGPVWYRPYSRSLELEADKKGMEYWHRSGWDCRIWVRIFENFLAQGYNGDIDHPTIERLSQAKSICHAETLPNG